VDRKWGDEEIQGIDSYQVVQCLGCAALSFRSIHSNSEDLVETYKGSYEFYETEEVYPPRVAGRSKLRDTDLLPGKVRRIYEETYKALSCELRILAAIGIRTLVESVCVDAGANGRSMEMKIDSLVGTGVLTKAEAMVLHRVRFVGNTAAHEVERYDLDTLNTTFEVAENLLQSVYILPEKASTLGEKKKRFVVRDDSL